MSSLIAYMIKEVLVNMEVQKSFYRDKGDGFKLGLVESLMGYLVEEDGKVIETSLINHINEGAGSSLSSLVAYKFKLRCDQWNSYIEFCHDSPEYRTLTTRDLGMHNDISKGYYLNSQKIFSYMRLVAKGEHESRVAYLEKHLKTMVGIMEGKANA